MQVVKRNGQCEAVDFNKITRRLHNLATDTNIGTTIDIDPIIVAQKVVSSIHNNITTHDLDTLASEISASLATSNPSYGVLAARIVASDLQKETPDSFMVAMNSLWSDKLISKEVIDVCIEHSERIENEILSDNDYIFDYFGLKTLQKAYLFKDSKGNTVERPQYMFMRVSIGIHGNCIESIIQTYKLMSNKYFIHATPTLYNSGTNRPQMSSCFLIAMKEDSIDGIYETLKQCAQISKTAGGIGLHIHNIRSNGSSVNGVKSACTGIIPMLRNFNATARYVDQGGKRPGSIAVYLQVDHPDIMDFLDMKKNTGDEEMRCRDLFYAVWVTDLFMERVKNNEKWSLFCPHDCPDLSELYGTQYKEAYCHYEQLGKFKKQIDAQKLWFAICQAQIETGTPYVLYKDAINTKSNQQNVGIIKSSNLCCEITEYSSADETAVCNLASISLPKFVNDDKTIDYEMIVKISAIITQNLNKIIDRNYYPTPESRRSNMRHRPIGIGVQGLADVYQLIGVAFDSPEARQINSDIFASIYYGSMKESIEQAKLNSPYETFHGSPLSKGLFQFDLWNKTPSKMYEWEKLREEVMLHGARNSLLVAPMPTASTSQILGNNEAIEPYTSNIYLRRTIAGEFVVVNKHLVRNLVDIGVWSVELKNKIVADNGSVQNCSEIPQHIKDIYKTVWEISQKCIIDQAAERGIYVCQSQSMNLFVAHPSVKTMSSMHFYSWTQGLKTGMYYLRTKPVASANKFTIQSQDCTSCGA